MLRKLMRYCTGSQDLEQWEAILVPRLEGEKGRCYQRPKGGVGVCHRREAVLWKKSCRSTKHLLQLGWAKEGWGGRSTPTPSSRHLQICHDFHQPHWSGNQSIVPRDLLPRAENKAEEVENRSAAVESKKPAYAYASVHLFLCLPFFCIIQESSTSRF